MPHILIVGKSFSGLKHYLNDHGYSFTVIQDRLATKYPDKRFKNRTVTDFSSTDLFLRTVDHINSKKHIDGILATYENYILPASQIAAHLGLPAISERSAKACTDKELMRELFAQYPEKISPSFSVVRSEADALEFAKEHSYPLIIKPANLSKSLLVTKSLTRQELLENYQNTVRQINAAYKKYAPNQQPKLLIEEFLEGPIFSVDAFVDKNGHPHVLDIVVDYKTGYDIGFDDNFHYSRIIPSVLDRKHITAIKKIAADGCRALEMKSSPAHVEIIYTDDGPRIVEIGARNGGYRERMHWLGNEIDITANAVALSLDHDLNIKAKKRDFVGVFELFPMTPGEFVDISCLDELKSLPSFNYLSVKVKPGEYIGKSGDGYKMSAVIILHHQDKLIFEKDVNFLTNSVKVITN